ncbi:MAG: hypothetical protein IRZ04_08260 [Rhodospirillales bacterium]|nr:hypothetical protein [Rhodospirillales bacterium]
MNEISNGTWSETDAANNAATPNGWPEGQPPSSVNDCARMMMGAVKRFWNRINGAYVSTGAGNAYDLSPAVALSAYVAGERYSFRANMANTGPATLNISGLGAKAIKKMTGSGKADLDAGDIQNGQPVTVEYDGTDLVMVTPTATTAAIARTDSANVFTADQTIRKSDDGAVGGPVLQLDRVSGSPAANDSLGRILFTGRDSAGDSTAYALMSGYVSDPTNGSEDGGVTWDTIVAGAVATRMSLGAGLFMAGTVDKGVGTINAAAVHANGVQLFGPRAVVKLTGLTTTPTITPVFNTLGTLSASRSSAGVYVLSWTTSLTNPAPFPAVRRSTANAMVLMPAITSTSVTLRVASDDSTLLDPDEILVTIYGS